MAWSDVKGNEILHFVQDDNPRIVILSAAKNPAFVFLDLGTEVGEVFHVS